MKNNKTLIEFKNVSFRYESEDETLLPLAVNNINLSVKKGEFLAILGHNGSGKSTIAKLCNAILLPTEGEIFVNNLSSNIEENEYEIRKTIGLVFQNPDNQIVASIVEEDVAFGPENLGVEPKEIRKRVDDALKSVNMYEHRHKEPHKLSGGQKQRVAIAGIIAMLTDCIVFDEPTAMLDPSGRKEVMQTILKLNKEMGKTIIYITHFMDEAAKADRLAVMDNGEIILEGNPKEVFMHSQKLKSIGLDVPMSTELASQLIKEGFNIPPDLISVNEFVDAFEKIAPNSKA